MVTAIHMFGRKPRRLQTRLKDNSNITKGTGLSGIELNIFIAAFLVFQLVTKTVLITLVCFTYC